MAKGNNGPGKAKKMYFRILSWFLVCLFFVLIEILLRFFSAGNDLHLFVENEAETPAPYLKVNPLAGEKYFTRFEATSGTSDLFLKEKPEHGFRVFLLGSSTLYGYPYDRNLMASRILNQRLQDAYPEKIIEVVNTSITAINSVTLKDYIKQVLKQEPDAILIYAGHNEYYGAFGIGSNETMSRSPFLMTVHFRLMNVRLYQWMRSAIGGISGRLASGSGTSVESGPLMKRIVKDEAIVYQGDQYLAGKDQFNSNLAYILGKAQKAKVPVFLSDLVSNVKDLPPFGDQGEGDSSAKLSYEKAQAALENGDNLSAKELFYRAKDLDPIRFRASEELNEIIYRLADEYGAIQIPARDRFSGESEDGLIGNNLLTEHVHPNIQGQFVLADAFYSSIVASELAGAPLATELLPDASAYQRQWPYTELDSLIGVYKINFLKSHWPFTSLENDLTFRDTFVASGLIDSIAFSILTNPASSIESLHLQLAKHYERENKLYLALDEYEALQSIDPFRAIYYTGAAACMLRLNDLFAGELYLRESLRRGEDLLSYSLLGEIELIKHNYSSAADLYRTALEISEKDRRKSSEMATTAIEIEKKLNQAEALSKKQLPLSYLEYPAYIPKDIEELYTLAITFTETNLDSALIYFKRCLEINDCPLVNFRIGDILYMKQDLAVMLYYDKAYPGFSKDPDFLVRYCVACLSNQETKKAKEIYQILSVIAPSHQALPNLRSALGL